MSDDNKPQQEAPSNNKPKHTGGKFRSGVSGNPRGRPKGAVGKVPSDKDIENSILKAQPRAVRKLLDLLDNGSEGNQLKAAFKIGDWSMQIVKDRNSVKVSKTNSKTGDKEEYIQEKATGTHDNKVLKLVSTEYKEDDESEEDENK
tara:strand:- start:46908 stop:47345 length:438 start_codon:yes stop_codon:yes gene_type:complete